MTIPIPEVVARLADVAQRCTLTIDTSYSDSGTGDPVIESPLAVAADNERDLFIAMNFICARDAAPWAERRAMERIIDRMRDLYRPTSPAPDPEREALIAEARAWKGNMPVINLLNRLVAALEGRQ